MNWSEYFFKLAELVAAKSKDPSTKVGCVITNRQNEVLSVGFNGFPRGVKDTYDRYNNRELKYKLIVHSETNAVSIAAKNGISLDDSILWIKWHPCSTCAKMLVQAGIKVVNIDGNSKEYNDTKLRERWKEEFEIAGLIFQEAGVEVNIIGDIND